MHVAIFGCGQLAQMMAQAGITLGLTFSFIANEGEDCRCVESLGKVVTYTPAMQAKTLFHHLDQPDVITVEKEMVDAELLNDLKQYTSVYPSSDAIYITQNRIREKNYIRKLDIPTADFAVITSLTQLGQFMSDFGLPLYVKAAESGYDGYHQWRIQSESELDQKELVDAINRGVSLIVEKHVPYQREVSVIAARSRTGNIVFYPLMENKHGEGVLIATLAPAPTMDENLEQQAFNCMRRLLEAMDYVGILTMECFQTDQQIIVNELAPRVHNSGHWTIEGSRTSQFENHCRAIVDKPLGEIAMCGAAGLVNMLGKHADAQQFTQKNMSFHTYGKQERPRRKLGHITVCDDNIHSVKQSLNQVITGLYSDRYSAL